MKKYRIKVIDPYRGLLNTVKELSSEYPLLEFDTSCIPNIEPAVQMAKEAESNRYDAILARGDTTTAIKKAVSIPVFNIEVTGLDIIRVFPLTESYSKKWAFVGFPTIMNTVHSMYMALHNEATIRIVNSIAECDTAIRELRKDGCSMIVGDASTANIATRYGLNSILITSSKESLVSALDNVDFYFRHSDNNLERIRVYQEVMNISPRHTLIFDRDKKLILYSGYLAHEIASHISSFIDDAFGHDDVHSIISLNDQLWQIESRRLDGQDMKTGGYVAFFCNQVNESPILMECNKTGNLNIFKNAAEVYFPLNTHPHNSASLQKAYEALHQQSDFLSPMLFIAETGLDIDSFVYSFYKNCPYSENAMLQIDCSALGHDGRISLFQDPEKTFLSLIHDTDYILYLKNIHDMPRSDQLELLNALKSQPRNNLHIILHAYELSSIQNKKQFLPDLYFHLSPQIIMIPPLRERQEDIRDYCNLAVAESNIVNGSSVSGIEDDALEYIMQYSWPGNMTQLQNTITRITKSVKQDYISLNDVKKVIEAYMDNDNTVLLPALIQNGSLEEIEDYIIKTIYELEGRNVTKTASHLKIARSTLWRKLYKTPGSTT